MSAPFAPPETGDIVWCRFPQDKIPHPGPKPRPALVLRVDALPKNEFAVVVAYGTSKNVNQLFSGEFALANDYAPAGLAEPAKFNLFNAARLVFDDAWFSAPSGSRSPVMGRIQLEHAGTHRRLQGAIDAVRASGGFTFLDAA